MAGDLQLLRRQLVERGRTALASGLAARAQLVASALGPGAGAQALEPVERGAQMRPRLLAAAVTAQVLAEDELRPRPVERRALSPCRRRASRKWRSAASPAESRPRQRATSASAHGGAVSRAKRSNSAGAACAVAICLARTAASTSSGAEDQEAVLDGSPRQPERAGKRGRLRLRQTRATVEDRPDELMQRGERELGLGVDPTRAQHPHPRRPLDRVPQQRRLADAGLAKDHQGAAARGPGGGDQALDRGTLRVSAERHMTIGTPPMRRELGPNVIRLGAECAAREQDDRGVTVRSRAATSSVAPS